MLCRHKAKVRRLLKNAVTNAPFRQNVAEFLTPRGNYAILTDSDVQSFEKLLGSSILKSDAQNPSALDAFNIDWTRQHEGQSSLVLQPSSNEQIVEIVKLCLEKHIALCVQGGNTGLVKGSIPIYDEVILSMAKMNRIVEFEPYLGLLTCEAGCILQNLETFVNGYDYTMPIDLGSKGSCQIGGNISTAAGGVRFVRYGSLHSSLIGLEAIIPGSCSPETSILNCMGNVLKDNMGMHMSHLFLGAEGQLGILSKIRLRCSPLPKSVNVALLELNSFDKCLRVLSLSKKYLGEILSAFELIDKPAVECMRENLKFDFSFFGTNKPLNNFYILIETMGSNLEHDQAKIEQLITCCLNDEVITDGILSLDSSQSANIWKVRESITPALQMDGYVYKHDISLPLENYYETVNWAWKVCGSYAKRIVGFGHLADGNVHLNVTCPQRCLEIEKRLYPHLYGWINQMCGSISAEHGVGFSKLPYLAASKKAPFLKYCSEIKNLFDPRWILNPYKTLPR